MTWGEYLRTHSRYYSTHISGSLRSSTGGVSISDSPPHLIIRNTLASPMSVWKKMRVLSTVLMRFIPSILQSRKSDVWPTDHETQRLLTRIYNTVTDGSDRHIISSISYSLGYTNIEDDHPSVELYKVLGSGNVPSEEVQAPKGLSQHPELALGTRMDESQETRLSHDEMLLIIELGRTDILCLHRPSGHRKRCTDILRVVSHPQDSDIIADIISYNCIQVAQCTVSSGEISMAKYMVEKYFAMEPSFLIQFCSLEHVDLIDYLVSLGADPKCRIDGIGMSGNPRGDRKYIRYLESSKVNMSNDDIKRIIAGCIYNDDEELYREYRTKYPEIHIEAMKYIATLSESHVPSRLYISCLVELKLLPSVEALGPPQMDGSLETRLSVQCKQCPDGPPRVYQDGLSSDETMQNHLIEHIKNIVWSGDHQTLSVYLKYKHPTKKEIDQWIQMAKCHRCKDILDGYI
jgi:hypothetical protein